MEGDQIDIAKTATEDFWLETGRKVPRVVTRPQNFVEDTIVILSHGEEGNIITRNMNSTKYASNTESWLKDELSQS